MCCSHATLQERRTQAEAYAGRRRHQGISPALWWTAMSGAAFIQKGQGCQATQGRVHGDLFGVDIGRGPRQHHTVQ